MYVRFPVGPAALELVEGDITHQRVDAIVNAANTGLRGGSGVDGAIHRAGGPSIMAECRQIGSCPTGQAVVTGAGNLPCRHVIHAVGPIWNGGSSGEPAMLESAYRSCMARAREIDAASVAFPSLSTGAYSYPLEAAAELAVCVVTDELRHGTPSTARFVLFGRAAFEAFRRVAEDQLGEPG